MSDRLMISCKGKHCPKDLVSAEALEWLFSRRLAVLCVDVDVALLAGAYGLAIAQASLRQTAGDRESFRSPNT
jgi:hypothetical protein